MGIASLHICDYFDNERPLLEKSCIAVLLQSLSNNSASENGTIPARSAVPSEPSAYRTR
jgi:hypothetical protein